MAFSTATSLTCVYPTDPPSPLSTPTSRVPPWGVVPSDVHGARPVPSRGRVGHLRRGMGWIHFIRGDENETPPATREGALESAIPPTPAGWCMTGCAVGAGWRSWDVCRLFPAAVGGWRREKVPHVFFRPGVSGSKYVNMVKGGSRSRGCLFRRGMG